MKKKIKLEGLGLKPFSVFNENGETFVEYEVPEPEVKKPMEFWISPRNGEDCKWTNLYPDASWSPVTKPLIHIIEYSAYESLKAENEKLRAAASILINVMTLLEDASRDDVAREHCSEALKQYREAVGE